MTINLKSHLRSVAKTITWRTWAAVDTMVIAYFLTGKITVALGIIGLDSFTKVFWYYLHERLWA